MTGILYLLVFITTALFFLIFYELLFHRHLFMAERLDLITQMSQDETDDEFKEPFMTRVLKPMYEKIIRAIGSIAPRSIKEKYQFLIITSGSGRATTFNSVLMTQILLACIFGGITVLGFRYNGSAVNKIILLLIVTLGFLLPVLSLYSKAEKRKEKVKKALPDLLDLLYVSVEAGLGFDLALKRSAEKMSGPLSEEVIKTLNEISRGRGREDAFRGLARRVGAEELGNFVTAIIQTEQLGSNIANMLRIQSVTMRRSRRQRAEEKAAKMPIKMLFPLIFFMFPSLFVVLLGPALINIYENFVSVNW